MKDSVSVQGVMLRRSGSDAIVEVEIEGKWVEVIREQADANYSHIVEPHGIRNAVEGKPSAVNPTTGDY
jgi:hypothetical protein